MLRSVCRPMSSTICTSALGSTALSTTCALVTNSPDLSMQKVVPLTLPSGSEITTMADALLPRSITVSRGGPLGTLGRIDAAGGAGRWLVTDRARNTPPTRDQRRGEPRDRRHDEMEGRSLRGRRLPRLRPIRPMLRGCCRLAGRRRSIRRRRPFEVGARGPEDGPAGRTAAPCGRGSSGPRARNGRIPGR